MSARWSVAKAKQWRAKLCYHDVLRPDGSMLYDPERDAIRRVTGKTS